MLKELKAFALLAGSRGQDARDTVLLARALVGLSRCIADNPRIATIEVNPFILWQDGGNAVDVVIEMTQANSEREELCRHG